MGFGGINCDHDEPHGKSFSNCKADHHSGTTSRDEEICLSCEIFIENSFIALRKRAREEGLDFGEIENEISNILNQKGVDRSQLPKSTQEELRRLVEMDK